MIPLNKYLRRLISDSFQRIVVVRNYVMPCKKRDSFE